MKKRYTQSLKDIHNFFIFTKIHLFSRNPTLICLLLCFYASKFLSLNEFLYYELLFYCYMYFFFILSTNYWSWTMHLKTIATLYLLSNYIYFIIEFYRNLYFRHMNIIFIHYIWIYRPDINIIDLKRNQQPIMSTLILLSWILTLKNN